MSNYRVEALNNNTLIIERRQGALKSLPAVIFIHGGADSAGNALTIIKPSGTGVGRNYENEVFKSIADAGYRVIAPAVGASFGATAGQNIIDSTYTRLQTDLFPAKVHLMGGSAGACLALNWMWRNSAKVASAFLYVPLVDVEALYNRDNTFRAAIEAAYGHVPTQTDYDNFDPSHNHANIAPQASKIKVWYGTNDTVIPVGTPEAFITAIGCESTQTAANHFNGYDPLYWNRQEPVAWFNNHP
ncbi:MAG: Lipolytic protein [Patescibacteria group bacterium]|nr:Lipolytic protein [Patescibacteria group bacterium]